MLKEECLIYKLSKAAGEAYKIDSELFPMYNMERDPRNEDGNGVLVGLTQVGNVVGYEHLPGGGLKTIPDKLFYRGHNVGDLARNFIKEERFGFEEVTYLLLSGKPSDKEELPAFKELLSDNMPLEQETKTNILDLEEQSVMNILARNVSGTYTLDANPDDTSRDNLMRQSIELISKSPTTIAYAYNIYHHNAQGHSLYIRHPHENLSTAESFLHMLRHGFTDLDARTLDLLLVLQTEHGGGNSSTFTVRVTNSTGTDAYSSITAGIGSSKGPLYGSANIQAVDMFHRLKEGITDWKNMDEIDTYFMRMLNKEAYNRAGLIYGIGHAVYTISDPRAVVLEELARDLAEKEGRSEEFAFLELLEERAIECLAKHKGTKKRASSNVNSYSEFVYEMVGLPQEIYTPSFAMARIVGWTAHRVGELNFDGRRIIHPTHKNVLDDRECISINER